MLAPYLLHVHKFREKENWSTESGIVEMFTRHLSKSFFFVLLSFSWSVSFINCTTIPEHSVVSTLYLQPMALVNSETCSSKMMGDEKLFFCSPAPLLYPSLFKKWQFLFPPPLLSSSYIPTCSTQCKRCLSSPIVHSVMFDVSFPSVCPLWAAIFI